jgi:hypothetical protein
MALCYFWVGALDLETCKMYFNKPHSIRIADDIIFKISCWFIILFPVLLRLPIGMGYRYTIVVRTIALLPLLTVILIQFLYIKWRKITSPVKNKDYLLSLSFFLVWGVAIFRTAYGATQSDAILFLFDLFTFIVVACLVIFAIWLAPDNKVYIVRRSIILTFEIYIALNFFLYLFQEKPSNQIYLAEYPAQMLSAIGISINRAYFLLTDGINYSGLLAGAVLVASVLALPDQKKSTGRVTSGFAILISLAVILLADSRGALAFSILAVVLLLFFDRSPRLVIWIAIIISISPIIITAFGSSLHFDLPIFLKRPTSTWITTPIPDYNDKMCELLLAQSSGLLSNRPIIWKIVLGEMSKPKITHLFGYGYRGHVVSKLSDGYSCLFKSYTLSKIAPAHNLWLQGWLDIGYLGVALMLGLAYSLALKLSKLFKNSRDYAFRSMHGVVIYIILIGSLEASLSPDFNELFIYFCLISIMSIFDYRVSTNQLVD